MRTVVEDPRTMRRATKPDGTGRVHLAYAGRRGPVILCSGRTMQDLVGTDRELSCTVCATKLERARGRHV